MGRGACKVERIEEQLQTIAACGAEALRSETGDVNMAKDLEVNRLSLPSAPPATWIEPFDLSFSLPPTMLGPSSLQLPRLLVFSSGAEQKQLDLTFLPRWTVRKDFSFFLPML